MKVLNKALLPLFFLAISVASVFGQTKKEAIEAYQLGFPDKAISIYRAISKADPKDVDAILSEGNLMVAKGDLEKAKNAYEKALAADPESLLSYVAQARLALLAGNIDEATSKTLKARKVAKGKRTDVLRAAGESYFFGKTRDINNALVILKEANESNPKDYATLMALGWAWREVPDGGKSVTFYSFASDLDPKDAITLFKIGQVYRQSRNIVKYEEFTKKALDVKPDMTIAARDLGDHYYSLRKMAPAKEMYDMFISGGKDITIEDEMQYANILFWNKDYPNLITRVEDIIKKDGSRNYLRRLLGYAAFETKDYDKGMTVMEEYFSKVSKDKIIGDDYEFYAKLLEKKGKDSLALENYLLAAKGFPNNWRNYKSASIIALGNKIKPSRPADALVWMTAYMDTIAAQKAREVEDVAFASTDYYYMGLADQRNKNYAKADASYSKVTEISPTAMSGWYSRAKNAKYLEPDVFKDAALAATYGVSKPSWDKVVELGMVDLAKGSAKSQVKEGLSYLSFYEVVKGNLEAAKAANNKILEIDPTDSTATQWAESLNSGITLAEIIAAQAAPADTIPVVPVDNGGSKN